MAVSLQARLSVLIVKWRVKRRLKGVRDYRVARQILRPDAYKAPPTIQISSAHLGGVPGERLEGPMPGDIVLVYLHGGGYFGCSAETHRPITAYYALHGFRVFAPDYRLAPEHRFPAAVEDAVAFYGALLSAGYPADGIVSADEVLRDDSTRLAERARAAGVSVELKIWPVVPHAWQLAPHLIPEARQSLRQSADFFRAHVAPAESSQEEVGSRA